ncbi:MAG: NUDIX hydrolase [Verrucomicrobiae bacterium]|nr:NUDIX hydrolase [Verrucomicrobiae bacterium]MDW8343688.1 NUDIX hydrolase [Verrucomicrobiae bacterium]
MLSHQRPIWQCGVIAWRREGQRVEFLLITSTRRNRWVIPKGHLEPDLTAAESALREAWEEAGVAGVVREPAVGVYSYEKCDRTYRVEVFVMEVQDVLPLWPEADRRTRRWVSWRDAVALVEEPGLKRLFRRVARQLPRRLGSTVTV